MPGLIGHRTTIRWLPVCLVLLAGLLLLGQQTLKIPGDTRLAAAIHNAMHVPWAMVLSFIVWKLSGSWLRTFVIIPIIGLISEGLQHLTGRSPSLYDIFSDFLGLGLAGCVYALFVQTSRSTIWLPILGILCICIWTTRPIAMVFASESWLYARSPLLFDGRDPRGFYLADFTAETDYNMFSGESVRLTLTDDQWSGVHIKTFPGVQEMPEFLLIELTVHGSEPLTLGLSARYWRDDNLVWKDFRFEPGYSTRLIPIKDIEADRWLPAIQDLYLYGYQRDAGRSFQLHSATFVGPN